MDSRLDRTACCLPLLATLLLSGCSAIGIADLTFPSQHQKPVCLIVGFVGGRGAWDDERQGVRRLALRLMTREPASVVQTFENRSRELAQLFVTRWLDRNGNGTVESSEAASLPLIVFGQSFGGAATVEFARQLERLDIPVYLTVQIDSVGRDDSEIPGNVLHAANLYQKNGWLIRGEHPIRALDDERTAILGNWSFDYSKAPGSRIPVHDIPWWKLAFRVAHARMDRDPRVWDLVASLIEAACREQEFVPPETPRLNVTHSSSNPPEGTSRTAPPTGDQSRFRPRELRGGWRAKRTSRPEARGETECPPEAPFRQDAGPAPRCPKGREWLSIQRWEVVSGRAFEQGAPTEDLSGVFRGVQRRGCRTRWPSTAIQSSVTILQLAKE